MALAITVTAVNAVGNQMRVLCTLTPSGSYVAGGDTLDFTTVMGAAHGIGVFVASLPPIDGQGSTTTGYDADFVPGTTLSNGKVKFLTGANTEISASAYPSQLIADTNINFEFIFDKLL